MRKLVDEFRASQTFCCKLQNPQNSAWPVLVAKKLNTDCYWNSMRKITVINGVEGFDIPYHLQILGRDVNDIKNTFFVSLNDHYGLHTEGWKDLVENTAQKYDRVIFYDLVNHGDEYLDNFSSVVQEFPHSNKWYLTNNFSGNLSLDDITILPWDFMWNRSKLYYTDVDDDYVRSLNLILHHYAGKNNYILNNLDAERPRTRTFLNLCGRGFNYRLDLYYFLQGCAGQGYSSMRSLGLSLEDNDLPGAYRPVPNQYYDDSYVSIYVESNCSNDRLIHITEKTFEPLFKGHFVLPFANKGTIQRLRELGFRFPDFLDYSYDDIDDVRWRFAVYKKRVADALKLPWEKLYKDNFDIIEHNRNQLYTLDYDRSILKLFDE